MEQVEKIVFNVSRVCGIVSILSCICVAVEAFADWKSAREKSEIVTRIQFLLQFPIGTYTLMYSVLGTIPAPTSSGLWLAHGNEASCNAQAFFILLSLSSGIPLDGFKNLTYLLGIQYGWDQERVHRIEPTAYAVILVYAMTLSIWSLAAGWFGPVHESCFISIETTDCDVGDDSELCEPTGTGETVARAIVFSVNMIHLFFSLYVVCRMYLVAASLPDDVSSQFTRKVAVKGMLYATAVSVAQVPLALWFVLGVFGIENMGLPLTTNICLSLVGFLNMLVFVLYRREMRTSYGTMVRRLLDEVAHWFCCVTTVTDDEPKAPVSTVSMELDQPSKHGLEDS